MLEDDQNPKVEHAGEEDSFSESGSRPFSSFSTREQQSPPQTENVRTKVSTWLSGLVEEVRRKSATPIQKWTDPAPNLTNKSAPQDVANVTIIEKEIQNEQLQKKEFGRECDSILPGGSKKTKKREVGETPTESRNEKESSALESCKLLTNNKRENTDSSKFWTKERILNRFGGKTLDKSNINSDERQQKQELVSETTNKITVSQITSIGRSKINDFYDKVRQNKARYYSLVKKDSIMNTSKSAEEQHTSATSSDIVEDRKQTKYDVSLKLNTKEDKQESAEEDDENEHESNIGNFNETNKGGVLETVLQSGMSNTTATTNENIPHLLSPLWRDDLLDASDASDEYPTYTGRLKLSQIGRSQTSNPAYNRVSSPLSEISLSSTSSIQNEQEINNGKRHLLSPPKSINLANIGRSFSERKDDEDEENDDFLLNERSHSCSHVITHQCKSQSHSISATGTTQPYYINNNENTINNNHHHTRMNNPKRNSGNVSSSLPSFLENTSNRSTSVLSANRGKLTRQSTAATASSALYRDSSLSLSDSPRRSILLRDSSFQSDSSHCSSVESLLEARKPDPEAILINLGFGPVDSEDILSRIPKRFLKNSQVRGIDTEAFLRRQQLANHLHDHSVLGYRGLVGNPDIPPSKIVAKIMERFELNERNRCVIDINMNRPQSAPPTPGPDQ